MSELSESEQEVFEYLNKLRESGVTNMLGAGMYLQVEFAIDKKEANTLLAKWMKQF